MHSENLIMECKFVFQKLNFDFSQLEVNMHQSDYAYALKAL